MAEEEEEVGAGGREWALRVALAGLSLSLVARWPPAELLYAHLARLRLTAARAPRAAHLALTVDSMQWDNQVRPYTYTLRSVNYIYINKMKHFSLVRASFGNGWIGLVLNSLY